jgi:predicted peptidase
MRRFLNQRHFPGLLLSLCVVSFNMDAQEFQKRLFTNNTDTLPYNILIPISFNETNDTAANDLRYPLIIFFHGAGERGTDNEKQTVHIRELFLNKENANKFKAFIFAPQCPEDKRWVESDWTVAKHHMPDTESLPMKLTMDLLKVLVRKYPIDTNRIYVTGLSMGGFGTWDILARYPGKFAAAVPICGGGDTKTAKTLISTPIWAFHGSNDKLVNVQLTRQMIMAIKEHGGNPRYTEYRGLGHNSWSKAYKEKGLLEWIFAQRLHNLAKKSPANGS